jgi:acyl-CoA synthetase (AMP-forming)/AMP-acid ligase II
MLPGPDDRTVLVDATGAEVTVADVRDRARQLRAESDRCLTFLPAATTLDTVTEFLALLEVGWPVFLMDPAWSDEQRQRLIDLYKPPATPTHPDLAVLLTTSGSTGSPKLVRLSRRNVETNAQQIAATLGLRPDDRGVTALPLHYSFGMSVVTSHVLAGSSVLVTDKGLLDRAFWDDLDRAGVTFLPGVPQSYAMLRRLALRDRAPSLRALIQAGGRLDPALVTEFAEIMAERDGQFFVMYGQTEASPRMACLPPDRLGDKLGSAGQAMPGGQFEIDDGEVVYTGPNVMMGYAESAADLALPDTHGDTLRTGDLGYVDDEGFLFLTGRLKRIVKLAGNRVALDEIEALVPQLSPVAAVDAGERVVLFTVASADLTQARRDLARQLRVAAKLVDVRPIEQLPLLSSGKVDYARLTQEARDAQ